MKIYTVIWYGTEMLLKYILKDDRTWLSYMSNISTLDQGSKSFAGIIFVTHVISRMYYTTLL